MLFAASRVPLRVLYALTGGAATLMSVFRWRGELIDGNLERCLSGIDADGRARLRHRFYGYLGELIAEILHAARIDPPMLERRVVLENPELIVAAFAAGQRVMILAAHHCNWEWLLLRCSTAFAEPLVAAYKPTRRPSIDEQVRRVRERFGATLVPAKQIVRHLLERRGQVRLLALVADQSPAAGAEQLQWIEFFGQQTAFFTGPGSMAAHLGFTGYFAAMRRTRRGHYSVRFEPLQLEPGRPKLQAVVAAYAASIEARVRTEPVEYFWAYRRWKRERGMYE